MSPVELGTMQAGIIGAVKDDGGGGIPALQWAIVALCVGGGAYLLWTGRRMAVNRTRVSSLGMEKAVRMLAGVVAIIVGLLLAAVAISG
jgi:hypothetical protein